ncbi:MAG: hypothetical protein OHK0022_18990 [Roseiflexaceae bacterium]
MPKITFIGAGSTVFAKNLIGDILTYQELADSTLTLFDIDAERLHTSAVVARKVAAALGVHPTIEATTDRRCALDGADYALCMIQVAGYKPGTVIDFAIPPATACAKPSPIRSASAGSCAGCAPSRCCWAYAATWNSCAPMSPSSIASRPARHG